jgi:hypothetical protein
MYASSPLQFTFFLQVFFIIILNATFQNKGLNFAVHSEREYRGRGPCFFVSSFLAPPAVPATQREKKDCEKGKEGAVIAFRRWGFKTLTAKKFVDLFQYRMLSLSTL